MVFGPSQEEGKLSARLYLISRQLYLTVDLASTRPNQKLKFSLQGDVALPKLEIEALEPFPPQEVGQAPVASLTN